MTPLQRQAEPLEKQHAVHVEFEMLSDREPAVELFGIPEGLPGKPCRISKILQSGQEHLFTGEGEK